jgi:hypothetical protein
VISGDVLEPIPWRDEQQASGLVAFTRSGRCRHAGPERFANEQQRRAIEAMRQCDGLLGISDQTLFGRRGGSGRIA